jgi:4-hydroxybutyryl-CoA synthetase (ADP-forming)
MNGFTGNVYPVSPTRETVFYKKAYKSVLDIPKTVDLAVIVIKNTLVANVLEECGKKKIKGVIIITAGFKEVDEEGAKREQELKDIAKKYKIQIIGPNCLGVMCNEFGTKNNDEFYIFKNNSKIRTDCTCFSKWSDMCSSCRRCKCTRYWIFCGN